MIANVAFVSDTDATKYADSHENMRNINTISFELFLNCAKCIMHIFMKTLSFNSWNDNNDR
jgi:hypothetical protein